jgi:hypothetical protein
MPTQPEKPAIPSKMTQIDNLELDFYKLLPSPFGRGAGGESLVKLHKKGKRFVAESHYPNPGGRGDGTRTLFG